MEANFSLGIRSEGYSLKEAAEKIGETEKEIIWRAQAGEFKILVEYNGETMAGPFRGTAEVPRDLLARYINPGFWIKPCYQGNVLLPELIGPSGERLSLAARQKNDDAALAREEKIFNQAVLFINRSAVQRIMEAKAAPPPIPQESGQPKGTKKLILGQKAIWRACGKPNMHEKTLIDELKKLKLLHSSGRKKNGQGGLAISCESAELFKELHKKKNGLKE